MTEADNMQTPSRGRGTNKDKPVYVGTIITPSTVRNRGATDAQNEEERSANREAQPEDATTMDVDTTAGNKRGRAVNKNDPVKEAVSRTTASLRKTKEKKIAAKTKQSTISLPGSQQGEKQRNTQTKRRPGAQ